jgi:hypothetical protein
MRRNKERTAPAAPPPAAPPAPTPEPAAPPAAAPEPAAKPAAAAPEPAAKPAAAVDTAAVDTAAVDTAAVEAVRPARATAVAALDRDSLTEAWGDGILQSLPARAKARYASGRFVAVDEQGAHFALPNAAHRDQCAEQKALVEEALSSHFGTAVTLVLQIDDAAPAAQRATPAPGGGAAAPTPTPPPDDMEDMDPHDLVEDASSDQASDAEARLLQAFPGASEVPG